MAADALRFHWRKCRQTKFRARILPGGGARARSVRGNAVVSRPMELATFCFGEPPNSCRGLKNSANIWPMTNLSALPKEATPQPLTTTLGAVLYGISGAGVPEQVWVKLVESIAAGDEHALHVLYGMANRIVFTFVMRITANRQTAEELTIDVFHDIWRGASRYDPAKGEVLGWIMNQARSRAIDRLRFDNRKRRKNGSDTQPPVEAADPHDVLELREQEESLRTALATLTAAERQAIEMTFFAGHTHAEAAARLNEPLGTVKTRIRSGLYKLRKVLTSEGGKP